MSAPTTTQAWSVTNTSGGFDALSYNEQASIPELGVHDVLVKLHAASLNYRDLIIPKVSHVQIFNADLNAFCRTEAYAQMVELTSSHHRECILFPSISPWSQAPMAPAKFSLLARMSRVSNQVTKSSHSSIKGIWRARLTGTASRRDWAGCWMAR